MHKAIVEDLNALHKHLGNGSQIIRDDAAASGMNCARVIGKIEGLALALTRIEETADDLSGKKKDVT